MRPNVTATTAIKDQPKTLAAADDPTDEDAFWAAKADAAVAGGMATDEEVAALLKRYYDSEDEECATLPLRVTP
jgi:hypothetical protein